MPCPSNQSAYPSASFCKKQQALLQKCADLSNQRGVKVLVRQSSFA